MVVWFSDDLIQVTPCTSARPKTSQPCGHQILTVNLQFPSLVYEFIEEKKKEFHSGFDKLWSSFDLLCNW